MEDERKTYWSTTAPIDTFLSPIVINVQLPSRVKASECWNRHAVSRNMIFIMEGAAEINI